MITITFQRFSLIQNVCLYLIFYDKLLVSVKIWIVLGYSIFILVWLVSKMEHLLEQMNSEIKTYYLNESKKTDELKKSTSIFSSPDKLDLKKGCSDFNDREL